MTELFISIALKLTVAMICIILFLRFSGKTQISQLTALDIVNGLVLGGFVGDSILEPSKTLGSVVFAIIFWTFLNLVIRFLTKSDKITRFVYGNTITLINDEKVNLKEMQRNNIDIDELLSLLREKEVFSLFDIDVVKFEYNGKITAFLKKEHPESYLLVNRGKINKPALKEAGLSYGNFRKLLASARIYSFKDLYAVEWTKTKGFVTIDNHGNLNRLSINC